MQKLTDVGENLVNDIMCRYRLSYDAVIHMLVAVNNGGCSMAQFSCPELGGSGQWMRGGMTMVGDMFNSGLKNTVDNLCNELANILSNNQVFAVIEAGTVGSNQWWPTNLGSPSSSGGQNNIRYAVFPNRLAVELNGCVTIYDTLDHNIGGVSQQQGHNDSLTFSSQWGSINVNSLPLVSGDTLQQPHNQIEPAPQNNFIQMGQQSQFQEPQFQQSNQAPVQTIEPINVESDSVANTIDNSKYQAANEMIDIIKKLAELRYLGVLTDSEFDTKKAELLKKD